MLAVVTWLTLHGCSMSGAADIAAHLKVESRLDPSAVGRSGLGLPQWAGHRRARMIAALGSRWRDGYAQLAFLRNEAIELGIWPRVCAATDPGAAAAIFMDYERPRNRDPRHRASIARAIYAEFQNEYRKPYGSTGVDYSRRHTR